MEQVLRDFRLALRRLRMAPGFTLFAVVSLALGIGVSTAIYSAVRTLLWMPLGVAEPADFLVIQSPRIFPSMSWPDFQDYRAQQTACSGVAASVQIRTALRADIASQSVFGEAVSGQYFTVMRLRPRLGRLIDAGDESSAARVAVVSESFWRTRLEADPAIVGRRVTLGGEPFEVVGVIAGPFRGFELVLPHSVWVPVTSLSTLGGSLRAFGLSPGALTERRTRAFGVWGRLRSDGSLAQVRAEAALIGQRLDAAYPPNAGGLRGFSRDWEANVYGQQRRRGTEGVRTVVTAVLVAIAVVLLIACTNLANLALARGTARAQETAVRTALGASRWRLVREQLIESGIIVVAGAGLGLVLLARLVDYFTTDLPMGRGVAIPFRPEIDLSVLAACLLSTVIALLVFGLWPAVRSTRSDFKRGLGAGGAATPARWRLHSNMIAWQVCGSVALLLVAVMAMRIIGVTAGRPGASRYQGLALAQIDFALNGVEAGRVRPITDAILEELRGVAGLQRVAAINGAPSSFSGVTRMVTRPDVNAPKPSGVAGITPGLLATLNVELSRGRGFTDRDDAAAPPVAIVSEQLARDLFQTADVVGRTLALPSSQADTPRAPAPPPPLRLFTIVGVMRDVMSSPGATAPDRLLFLPLAQEYEHRAPMLVIARAEDPSAAAGRLREGIRRRHPTLVLGAAGTGTVLLEGPFFLLRVIASLSAVLGALALILAMAGLFGILTHVVERRTREIGIRLAIGAARVQILRLILRDGLHPVVKGLTLGLAIGLGSRIVLRGQVFTTIGAWDPLEFCVLPLVFLAAALIACAVPASRASRVDPNVALRDL
jgi:predicted permease